MPSVSRIRKCVVSASSSSRRSTYHFRCIFHEGMPGNPYIDILVELGFDKHAKAKQKHAGNFQVATPANKTKRLFSVKKKKKSRRTLIFAMGTFNIWLAACRNYSNPRGGGGDHVHGVVVFHLFLWCIDVEKSDPTSDFRCPKQRHRQVSVA